MATARIMTSDDEAQVRGLIDDWANAVRLGDIDGIMSFYAPEIVSFDAIARLRFEGREGYRRHWEACLAMCSGPSVFELHDLRVEARSDLAFAYYLSRCGGTGPDGVIKVGWMRGTVCCQKANSRWLVVHEHFSAPFDMESGKALFDREP